MSKKSFVSKLAKAIDDLSVKAKYQSKEEAIEALRRAGVKDAELQYSGLEDLIKVDTNIDRTALMDAEARRPDQYDFRDTRDFSSIGTLREGETYDDFGIPRGEYSGYVVNPLDNTADENNYREFIMQFSNSPEQRNPEDITATRSYSSHFQDIPNYQGHVRTIDEIWDGEPVLNVNEVQSDVLGHALQRGSVGEDVFVDMDPDDIDRLSDLANEFPANAEFEDLHDSALAEFGDEINKILAPHTATTIDDIPVGKGHDFLRYGEIEEQSGLVNTKSGPGPDRMPNTKNYRERLLERALDVAQSEGKTKLVVPLEDSSGDLIENSLYRGKHIQSQEYDAKKGRVPKALKKIARDQDMEYKTQEKDGVLYGVLDFKGKKKKPTELYGLGGGLMLTPSIIEQMYGEDS